MHHLTVFNASDFLEFVERESETGLKFISIQALVKISEVLKLEREEMNAFSVHHCCWCQLPRTLAKLQVQIN